MTSGKSNGVRTRLWRDGRLEVEDFPLEEISDHLQDDGALVWLDLCEPDHELLLKLAKELTLDPQAVEDAIAAGERPKATRHATHTFVTVYATSSVEVGGSPGLGALASRLQFTRVSAFVLPNGIVTIRSDPRFDMDQVVERWDDNADLLKLGSSALLHGLLDVIVDGHFETIQHMDDVIESLEDGLFDDKSVTREIQQRTYRVRKELVELRRVILPMREVVNAVQRHHADDAHSGDLDGWYADLYDHVLRASEWTESLRDMVTTVFETNLSLQDARLNTVMKKLTGWAAIIAVPTAVTGWFGQNVAYPGFGQHSGLIASTVVITGLATALYVMFRRRNWL